MVTYFNKKDMIDFANYLMSPGVMNRKSPTQRLVVTDADFKNWKQSLNNPVSKKMKPRDKFNLSVEKVMADPLEDKGDAKYSHTFVWENPAPFDREKDIAKPIFDLSKEE